MTQNSKEPLKVRIKRSINAYMIGEVSLDDIESVEWDTMSGGYNDEPRIMYLSGAVRPHWGTCHAGYALYGYISYELAMNEVDCSGEHRDYGGSVKVMIPKSLNKDEPYRKGYNILKEEAGEKPEYHSPNRGKTPCSQLVRQLLHDGPKSRETLYTAIKSYGNDTIRRCLARLRKRGEIKVTDHPYYKKQVFSI